MKVRVKSFTTIRNAIGASEIVVDTDGSTVGDIIAVLTREYGDKFREEVLNPDGTVKPHVRVLLNGHFIDQVGDPLRHSVSEGDTIFLFPPTAGG